ncbi:MAG: hypothetical protein J6A63_08440 [Clostridia bacterium]|nr:hypothetical protein [Clostridia bacterium]
MKGKNELDTSKSRKGSIFAVSVLGVREQEKRTFDEELRSISRRTRLARRKFTMRKRARANVSSTPSYEVFHSFVKRFKCEQAELPVKKSIDNAF